MAHLSMSFYMLIGFRSSTNYIEQWPDAVYPDYDSYIAETTPTFQWHGITDLETTLREYQLEVQREVDGQQPVHIWEILIQEGDGNFYNAGDNLYQVIFNSDGQASEALQLGERYRWNVRANFEDGNQSENGWPNFLITSNTESPIILNAHISYATRPNGCHLHYRAEVNDPQGLGDILNVKIRFPDGEEYDFQNNHGGGNYEGWYDFNDG